MEQGAGRERKGGQALMGSQWESLESLGDLALDGLSWDKEGTLEAEAMLMAG